jgi:hypothetical protein
MEIQKSNTHYSKSEIAQLYDGISLKTLRKWLIRVGIYEQMKNDKMLTIAQVQLIFDKLGRPMIKQL